MPSMEEQKTGVLLGIKARKQGVTSIVALFFVWTGIGGIISVICCMNGYRNAKKAKALAPDSPVVQSAYMINNIMHWFYNILSIPLILSLIASVIGLFN